jgi:hypothetical protein
VKSSGEIKVQIGRPSGKEMAMLLDAWKGKPK